MKKMSLFYFVVLLMLTAKAYASSAEAVFSVSDKDRIQVIIDGRLANETPQRQVYIQDRPGRHTIEIKVFNYWGRLQFIHHDRILVKPNSRNTFILQVHPYGNARLVQQTKTVPVKAVTPRVPKPIKHHVPMIASLGIPEFKILQETMIYPPSDQAQSATAQKSLQHIQWLLS